MKAIQIGSIAYKDPNTGEYAQIKPITRVITKELEQAEKELTSQILSFFANEFNNSQKNLKK